MNVLIVGAGKSPNVGDQLIEKVLGCTISEQFGFVKTINYYDLSYGEYDINFLHPEVDISTVKENKESSEKYYLPRFMKTLLSVKWNDNQTKDLVKKSDVVIIGGGHLLIDNYGVFLLNIIKITRLAKKYNKKVFFWSVGVGKTHSLIWKILAKLYFSSIPLYTRDNISYKRAKKLGLNSICSQLDPAFMINAERKPTLNRKLGLFIMDPYEMVRHCDSEYKREDIADWWIELIHVASKKFEEIEIFNNGSLQDFKFINKYISPKIDLNLIKVNGRALSSDILIEYVKKTDVILAQRLHAVIPSIAFGKKVLAIEWDDKLSNILADINFHESLISYDLAPQDVVDKLEIIAAESVELDLFEMKSRYIKNLASELSI